MFHQTLPACWTRAMWMLSFGRSSKPWRGWRIRLSASIYCLSVWRRRGTWLLLESLLQGMKAMAGAGQVQPLNLEQAYALFLEQESAGD